MNIQPVIRSLACVSCLWAISPTMALAASPNLSPSLSGSAAPQIPGDAYWKNTQDGLEAVAPTTIDDVLAARVLQNHPTQNPSIPWPRASALSDAAAAYGAQAGMAARANAINRASLSRAAQYDTAFNFSALMLEPGFLPPVISEGRDAYNQPSDTEVRAADRIYKIEFAARLVNTPPRWQDYLMIPAISPMAPDRTVLPSTQPEKDLWDAWAIKGWAQGTEQANQAFESNLARLRRDFEGMLRYKMLYQQGAVTKPLLAHAGLGVTGGGDEMAINDRIYRITDKAQLNPDQSRWIQKMPATSYRDTLDAPTLPPPSDRHR